MVGDWVMSFGVPHKVVGIRTDMFEPHIRTDMSDTWYEEGIENLLEPIPLTPEILEKNADSHFDERVYDIYCFHNEEDDDAHLVEITFGFGRIEWTINGNEYGIAEIKYVHELQHVLRLCKVDKEIVL